MFFSSYTSSGVQGICLLIGSHWSQGVQIIVLAGGRFLTELSMYIL